MYFNSVIPVNIQFVKFALNNSPSYVTFLSFPKDGYFKQSVRRVIVCYEFCPV